MPDALTGHTVQLDHQISLREHYDAMLAERQLRYELLYTSMKEFNQERDRRYAEVSAARAEALKIKEQADRDALQLDREARTYRDEQTNKLREQINNERGLYATHAEVSAVVKEMQAIISPLTAYIQSQQGRSGGVDHTRTIIYTSAAFIATLLTIGGVLFAVLGR